MADLGLDPAFVRRLAELSVVNRRILAGRMRGERRSKKRGISVEFADYRDYVSGDDLRFVDWNIYGRLDRMFLKLFLEEEDRFIYLLLDSSHSMAYGAPRKIDYAARVAAALGYVALSDMDRVALAAAAGGTLEAFRPRRGKAQVWRLFEFLEKVEPQGTTDLAGSVRRFCLENRRRGVVVVVSDFLDPAGYEEPLKALAGRGHEVFALHLLAREEVEPELQGDLKLLDVETEAQVEVSATRGMLRAYRRQLDLFRGGMKAFCAAHGVGYLFTSTAVPFEELVLSYLRAVGLVK
ncbi:MAG TPA: DUF58 domain-containing protein [Planctomycetota bacterium]|nr:DUF58 domain-containing protein [Planctomycetota bacterium]